MDSVTRKIERDVVRNGKKLRSGGGRPESVEGTAPNEVRDVSPCRSNIQRRIASRIMKMIIRIGLSS
jgi:hypothetical protein